MGFDTVPKGIAMPMLSLGMVVKAKARAVKARARLRILLPMVVTGPDLFCSLCTHRERERRDISELRF